MLCYLFPEFHSIYLRLHGFEIPFAGFVNDRIADGLAVRIQYVQDIFAKERKGVCHLKIFFTMLSVWAMLFRRSAHLRLVHDSGA